MASNFDNAAWFYDRLSRVVYGQALVKAQTTLLPLIPAGANILIAGGGTGWIIEEIGKIQASGLTITYVELSDKMMALSKQRDTKGNTLVYVNSPIEDAVLNCDFDVVVTPFLFDNFSDETFTHVFVHINNLLKPGGLWLNTDFQLTGKWWQPPLLQSMYLFFKILGCMEAAHLHNIKPRFAEAGYTLVKEHTFFGDFIGSAAYQKG